jgi:hypothetical protein
MVNRDDFTIVLRLLKALVRTCEEHGDRVVADLPAKIAAALARQRKAAMPAGTLFHAAFTRARGDGLVDHVDASSTTNVAGAPTTALATGSVLSAADVGKSKRPILRPYRDAVRACPFHCPLDLPVADGANRRDTLRTVTPGTDGLATANLSCGRTIPS